MSENVKDVIHGCSVKLKNLWERAFGTSAIKSLTAIKKQIKNYLKTYSTHMGNKKGSRTLKKHGDSKIPTCLNVWLLM